MRAGAQFPIDWNVHCVSVRFRGIDRERYPSYRPSDGYSFQRCITSSLSFR
jgi:hypothetical protein